MIHGRKRKGKIIVNEREKNKKFNKMRIFVIVSMSVAILIIAAKMFRSANEHKEPEIITKANLEKIIDVSDLSTLEAVYNGIAKVSNAEKTDEIDYYVSYEARVKAGIDFRDVEIDVNNEQKVITVTIPEIRINDVNVDIASLDYIFVNDEANTETVSEQAYRKCIEDVTAEAEEEADIYELAEENAKNIIAALIEPFVSQLDAEYKLMIK